MSRPPHVSVARAFVIFSALLPLLEGRYAAVHAADKLPLETSISGDAIAKPGTPLSEGLKLSNNLDTPLSAAVEYSVQHDDAMFNNQVPDPIYGTDRALGTKSWTEAKGEVVEQGSLTDGKIWTSAETGDAHAPYDEAFQYIDLGSTRSIKRITWEAADANWVAKVDVSGSPDGKTYTPVPSLQNINMFKKWGHNTFPLAEPFEARFLRFRYHNNGTKSNNIRMPAAIGVYDGIEGDSLDLPSVGRVFASGKATVQVPPHDSIVQPLTGADMLTPGSYLIATKVEAEKKTYLSWQHLMVMPAPIQVTEQSRFGLNADDPKMVDHLNDLGVGWVRFENMKWPFVSAVRGEFHYDGVLAPWHVNHDAIFENYRSHGINVLPFLFLTQEYETPPGTPPPSKMLTVPPKDFTQYAEFVYQTAARYGSTKHPPEDLKTPDKKSGLGLIKVFELWNEPNLSSPDYGHWKGPLTQYFEMFRLGAEAVKRADPTARVSNAGFSGIGVQLVDGLRSYKYADGKCALDFMDQLSVHFYTGQQPPEHCYINSNTGTFGSVDSRSFEENLVLLRAWRDRNKPNIPIWLTETGYETDGDYGVDERTQAAWLVRDVLLILANGIEKVMVFRETGSDSFRWGSAGVLKTDGTPKPSFFTYATMIREMNDVAGSGLRVATDKNLRIYAWKSGTQNMLTAWTVEGTANFPMNLGKATVVDAFGDRREGIDTTTLKLTTFPVYIHDCSDTAALEALVAKASQEEEQQKQMLQAQATLKAYLFGFGSNGDVGGFVIGDFRKSTPVVAKDSYDETKGYGFAPGSAIDDNDFRRNDTMNQHACKIAKGVQFRFRADPGKYLLRVGVVPFAPVGHLTIAGSAGGTKTVDVPKQTALVELEVEAGKNPMSIELDGYGSLRWLTLVQQIQPAK